MAPRPALDQSPSFWGAVSPPPARCPRCLTLDCFICFRSRSSDLLKGEADREGGLEASGMSFVSQAFDEVRASLLEASGGDTGGSSRPSTRATDGYGTANGAGDPHSRGADWSGRRVTSFFRDDKNNNHQPGQDGTLSGRRATRRLCRGEGSVSRTADTAFAALLERALRRNGAEAREVTLDATNTVSGPLDRTRSMEYNIELLVARAGALASERRQRSGSCAGSAPGASSVPCSPDSVATGALDASRARHDNATDSDGHDFFGLGAVSSTLQLFSTPTRLTTVGVAADPPKGCWGDVEVDTDASASISRNAKESEERVRSLCSKLLLQKRDDQSTDDDELGEGDQLKMRQGVIRLLVLLSESPATLTAGADSDGVPHQYIEDRLRQRPQGDLAVSMVPLYNIRDVVPRGSLCRPAFVERDIVLWSTMALTGVPSPPYRLVGDKLVQAAFNIHGESDSTSLFGVAQHFADAGSNYLYLAGISGHSSCKAWSSVIHRVEHHWLDRYRVLADAIKYEVESTSRDATPSVSLLDVRERARMLMSELASLASIIRRLSRSKPNGSCGIQESMYQLVVMEQLSAIPGNEESCHTLIILQDLFQSCLKGTVTQLYRKTCFGSLNSPTQAGDVIRLPSFLGDLSDQIGEATKCIDLVRESDRAVFTRLASFHREVGERDESLPFLWFGFTKEDLESIIKSQDDRLGRYQALIQGELESKGENSSLSGTTNRNDRELTLPSIESSSDNDRHVHSGTFPDLPVSPSWKQSDSTGVNQFVWTNESSKEEIMTDSFSSSFAEGGDLANTSKFFALPSELSPTLAGSLSLLGDISAKNDNILPIDISMERGIKRFIRKHCEMIEHFSLLFFVRESHLIEHLVLVRRIFVGYGCYLTRLISHCFLARVDDCNKAINEDFLQHLNIFCFIASPKEMDLLESVDVNFSLLASDVLSASKGLPCEHSELPAMQVQCPMSSIINDAAITKYRDLRAFIVRHLWVDEQRKLTWRRIVQMDRNRTWSNDRGAPRHLYIIRNEIGHLCSALSQYVNLSLQGSWQNLLKSLSLNSTNILGSMKEVRRLHQANLDALRANLFLVEDDSSLARVKETMNNLYKVIVLILKALVPSEVTGNSPNGGESSLSNLWKEYGDGRKALVRSLRIASATHSFSRDLMELLAGDNAGSHH